MLLGHIVRVRRMGRDRWLTTAVKMKQSQSQPSSSSPEPSAIIQGFCAAKPALATGRVLWIYALHSFLTRPRCD